MNEKITELLRLIKENPDLPILPMVDGEICAGDDYGYWSGSWGTARVDEFLISKHNDSIHFMTLYLIVCNTYLKGVGAMPFAEVMEQYKYLGLPSFESVGRTRRKLQAKYPELAGNARVRRLRAEGEKAYRKYAKK